MSAPTTDPRQRVVAPPTVPAPRMPYVGPEPEPWLLADLDDDLDPVRRERPYRVVGWPVVVIFALFLAALAAAVWAGTRIGDDATEMAQEAVASSAADVDPAPAGLPSGATATPAVVVPGDGGEADHGFLTAMLDGKLIPTYGDGTALFQAATLACEAMDSGAATWPQVHTSLVTDGWLPGDADYFLVVTTSTYCPQNAPRE